MLTEQDWQRPDLQPGEVADPGEVTQEVYVVDHFKGDIAGPYRSEQEALRANQPLGNLELRTDVTDLLAEGYKLHSPYAEARPPLSRIRPGSKYLSRSAKKRRIKGESLPSFEDILEGNLGSRGLGSTNQQMGRG